MRGGPSLEADYFEGIFKGDDDPWGLATSPYEADKYTRTIGALADRHYARALEVGCAHGVLTEQLVPLSRSLLALDISEAALKRARARLGCRPGLEFAPMRFPQIVPPQGDFDLVVLSEVAYYWDECDLGRAARFLERATMRGGRIILVHWTGETDYPQSGDQAVESLWMQLAGYFQIERMQRTERYRLDLWERR